REPVAFGGQPSETRLGVGVRVARLDVCDGRPRIGQRVDHGVPDQQGHGLALQLPADDHVAAEVDVELRYTTQIEYFPWEPNTELLVASEEVALKVRQGDAASAHPFLSLASLTAAVTYQPDANLVGPALQHGGTGPGHVDLQIAGPASAEVARGGP